MNGLLFRVCGGFTHSLIPQLIASPPMAANPVSHSQRRTSVVASTPVCSGSVLSE